MLEGDDKKSNCKATFSSGLAGRICYQGWDVAEEQLKLVGLDQITWRREAGGAFFDLIHSIEECLNFSDDSCLTIEEMKQSLSEKITQCERAIDRFCIDNEKSYQNFSGACEKYEILFNPIPQLRSLCSHMRSQIELMTSSDEFYHPLPTFCYESLDVKDKLKEGVFSLLCRCVLSFAEVELPADESVLIGKLLVTPKIWKAEVLRIFGASTNALVYINEEVLKQFPQRTEKMVATLREVLTRSNFKERKTKVFLVAGVAHLIRKDYVHPELTLDPLYDMLAKLDRSVVILYPKAILEPENSASRAYFEETKALYEPFKALLNIRGSAEAALRGQNLSLLQDLIFRTYISSTRAISALYAEKDAESLERVHNEFNPREHLYKLVEKLQKLDKKLSKERIRESKKHSWELWERKIAKIAHKMALIRERSSLLFREVVWD